MSLPLLIGPIKIGASFMIVSIQNSKPYFLNAIQTNNKLYYYWESDLSKIKDGRMGIFITIGSSINNITIIDTNSNNSGGIGFDTDNLTIMNVSKPSAIKINQSVYANWYPPDVFLSGVQYTIYNSLGQIANIKISNSTVLANNIVILPTVWYSNCTSLGNYNFINNPNDSVINWFCLVDSTTPGCNQLNIIRNGWTELDDCMKSKFYNYCVVGQSCGDSNCKGPCEAIYDDCKLIENSYFCVFNPRKFFTETEWWLNPYFIALVVTILIVFIVIIIVLIIVIRKLTHKKS